jgi:hypothetical protein
MTPAAISSASISWYVYLDMVVFLYVRGQQAMLATDDDYATISVSHTV